jgi:hypothetical protein
MVVQFIISFLVTLSIVASGLLLANAQKVTTPTDKGKAAVTQTKPGETSAQPDKGAKKSTDTTPAKETATGTKSKDSPLPVMMELSTAKDMFHPDEDIFVKAEIWAMQPVTLCLYSEHPEANFSADVFRAGYGKLDFQPNVVQLQREDMSQVERIKLDPGQMHRIVFNVKKLIAMPPTFWKSGEYNMKLKFFLCGKTESDEISVPSQSTLHLLVLD